MGLEAMKTYQTIANLLKPYGACEDAVEWASGYTSKAKAWRELCDGIIQSHQDHVFSYYIILSLIIGVHMKCSQCHKEIILVPSAKERSRKFGGNPNDYTRLFTIHTNCLLKLRRYKRENNIK